MKIIIYKTDGTIDKRESGSLEVRSEEYVRRLTVDGDDLCSSYYEDNLPDLTDIVKIEVVL